MINLGNVDNPSPGDVLLRSRYGGMEYFSFWCPGCKSCHSVNSTWTWNLSLSTPTITPSIKVTGVNEQGTTICHLYIRDGNIEYLDDCTHELKGQTIRMLDVANFLPTRLAQ
jgi:hypothetical protein